MNVATLLNELCAREVALVAIGPDRLRFEAKEAFDREFLANLREHKRTIIGILGQGGSTPKLLGRQCPFCRRTGMEIEETWKNDLQYFDTRCKHCHSIVDTFVPAACEHAEGEQYF